MPKKYTEKYSYSDRDLQTVIEAKEEWIYEQVQNRLKEIEEAEI